MAIQTFIKKSQLYMNSVWTSNRGKLIICVTAVLLLSTITISILKMIVGSLVVAVGIFLGLVCWLVRRVGFIIMYPGSFFYTRSEMELQYSRELSGRMVKCFNILHAARSFLLEGNQSEFQESFELAVIRHLKGTIAMLGMFEEGLSPRKQKLLQNYRELLVMVEENGGTKFSIGELMCRPRRLGNLGEEGLQPYIRRFLDIIKLVDASAAILSSFAPPDGLVAMLKYRKWAQSLFEMRFAYYYWELQVEYQLFSIKTQDGQHIQSALLSNLKSEIIPADNNPKKTVLFCNPNGVFMQFFFTHDYVTNYLRQGYRVILWNYRGYGESSGSPSLRTAGSDAYAVYRFYRQKGQEISVVHGYSIGGVAAVGLLKRISENYTKNPSDQVEALIIDRSFSSISAISEFLNPYLSKVAKFLYYFDDVDVARIYEGIKCKKMIIWDGLDEIIIDSASVKNSLLKRMKDNQNTQPKQRKDELNEEINMTITNPSSLVEKLQETLRSLLLRRRKVQIAQKQSNFNSEEQRETSMSTASGLQDYNFEPIIQVLSKIDGGGMKMLQNVKQLQTIMENYPNKFRHLCESFLLGLICYGSYLLLQPGTHNRQVIKTQTIQKLQKLLRSLSEGSSIDTDNDSLQLLYSRSECTSQQIRRNLYYIFSKARQLMETSFVQQANQKFGSLLPTRNGHNLSLTQAQMRILNDFLKTAHPHALAEHP